MRIKNFIILTAAILASCESAFLDRPPLDAIGTENYWQTAKDLENYVLQYYPSLPGHGWWALTMPMEDNTSDNLLTETQNPVLNGERGITGGRWIADWAPIRSVNIFFANYRNCKDNFSLYRHYVGEAHFFRAWYYFQLVMKYGDVPWYGAEVLPNDQAALTRPRDPRTMIVDSILADLDKASEYCNLRAAAGNFRINKEAALAFKTRVALFEGTWQKYHKNTPLGTNGATSEKYFQACVDAAKTLAGGQYRVGLHKDYYELFGLDNMSSSDEVLLYRAYNKADGQSNDAQFTSTSATGGMGVTWSLVSSYLDKTGNPYDYLALASTTKGNAFLTRITKDADPRLNHTIWAPGDLIVAESGQRFAAPAIDRVNLFINPTGFQIKKFSNPYSSGAGKQGGGSSETGYILFRYGEVLLNYAEALFELNGTIAYDALNQLRKRAGMPDFKVLPQSTDPNRLDYGYSIPDALYEIRRERQVETALEGKRMDDWRRWAAHSLFKNKRPKGYPFDQSEFPQYHPPLDENGLIDYFKNRLPNGYLFREKQDYLNSIPTEEITLNPNLVQNPGWQ